MVKIKKIILKTKVIINLILEPMERVPQSYPRKSVNSKMRKNELNSYTKPKSSYIVVKLLSKAKGGEKAMMAILESEFLT